MRSQRWWLWTVLRPRRTPAVTFKLFTVLFVVTFSLGLAGGVMATSASSVLPVPLPTPPDLTSVPVPPLVTPELVPASPGELPDVVPASPPVPPELAGIGPATAEDGAVGAFDLGDGTFTAPYEVVGGVKVFKLRMAPVRWEVSPGDVRTAWAFNGTVPGPTIRINEGDQVRFLVQNDLPESTGVHWHGMNLPNSQDGVPHLTQHPIEPGELFTYEWTAISTGSHWYHSHMGGPQVGKGLYGSLEIVPTLGDIRADRDYRVIFNDGALGFVLNGKSFPATKPLKAKVGERVRIRIIGSGPELIHSIHLHGGFFELTSQDGNKLPLPVKMDTVTAGPGQTYDIVFVPPSPGKWLLHCHIFSHSETPTGMEGMVTYLDVEPGNTPLPLPSVP
ncbi:MAG: multicopper oxidase family protein [Pseudonocardiales bacterium]